MFKAIGRLLFTEYVYPFELASVVILLVGIVAATGSYPSWQAQEQVGQSVSAGIR
jgi:hypothetical protein